MTDTPTAEEEDMAFPEGFGVGERTLGIRDLIQSEEELQIELINVDSEGAPKIPLQEEPSPMDDAEVLPAKAVTRTLSPKAVLRFIAPTMALWVAPPIMSLIDTAAVGRFCGSTDLAGEIFS